MRKLQVYWIICNILIYRHFWDGDICVRFFFFTIHLILLASMFGDWSLSSEALELKFLRVLMYLVIAQFFGGLILFVFLPLVQRVREAMQSTLFVYLRDFRFRLWILIHNNIEFYFSILYDNQVRAWDKWTNKWALNTNQRRHMDAVNLLFILYTVINL